MTDSAVQPTRRLGPADSAPAADGIERAVASARRGVLRGLLRDRTASVGLLIVALLALVAALAPLIAPYDPLSLEGPRLSTPNWQHPFGTDRLGRDILSRTLYGARLSLGTAALASVLVMSLGVVIGAISGYVGGLLDSVVMRAVDVILAFPSLILALVIAGMFNPSLVVLMLALASVWWVGYARIIRGLVLTVRERPFVEAAQAVGASRPRILVRHILPHVMSPVIVLVTLEMGSIILAVSALSFLGLGAQPPTPEWGAMLNEGRSFFFSAPYVIFFPGLAISVSVLGFNLLGDGLRDVLDPRGMARR